MKSNKSETKSTNKKKGTPNAALKHLEKSSDTEKEKPDGDPGKKTVFKWSGKP